MAFSSKVSVINICIQFWPKGSISAICGNEIDQKEAKSEFQNDTNPDVSTTVVKDSHKLEFLTTVSDKQLPKYHNFSKKTVKCHQETSFTQKLSR